MIITVSVQGDSVTRFSIILFLKKLYLGPYTVNRAKTVSQFCFVSGKIFMKNVVVDYDETMLA